MQRTGASTNEARITTTQLQRFGGDRAQLFGVGYRVGKFLPMLTYANYRQSLMPNSPSVLDGAYVMNGHEAHDTTSLLVRYDPRISSALKLQLDHWRDKSGALYALPLGTSPRYGNSNLLSASYDMVF